MLWQSNTWRCSLHTDLLIENSIGKQNTMDNIQIFIKMRKKQEFYVLKPWTNDTVTQVIVDKKSLFHRDIPYRF